MTRIQAGVLAFAALAAAILIVLFGVLPPQGEEPAEQAASQTPLSQAETGPAPAAPGPGEDPEEAAEAAPGASSTGADAPRADETDAAVAGAPDAGRLAGDGAARDTAARDEAIRDEPARDDDARADMATDPTAADPTVAGQPVDELTGDGQTGDGQTGEEIARAGTADDVPTDGDMAAGDMAAGDRAGGQNAGAGPAPDAAEGRSSGRAARAILPTFDLLRVEPDGSTVIAGHAAPDSRIEIVDGDIVVGSTEAGPTGDFAAVLDRPLPPGDHQLTLRSTAGNGSGEAVVSEEVATISIPERDASQLLAMVTRPDAASRIINEPAPALTPEEGRAGGGAAGSGDAAASARTQPATGGAVDGAPGGAGDLAPAAGQAPPDEAASPGRTGDPAAPDRRLEPPVEEGAAGAETSADAPAGPADAGAPREPAAREATPDEERSRQAEIATGPTRTDGSGQAPGAPAQPPRIDAVEIENDRLFVAGSAAPGAVLRIYAGETLVGETRVDSSGRFVVDAIVTLPVGRHMIRADLIDPQTGDVTMRAMVPFVRPAGEQVAAVARSDDGAMPEGDFAMPDLPDTIARLEQQARQALTELRARTDAGAQDEAVRAARSEAIANLRAIVEGEETASAGSAASEPSSPPSSSPPPSSALSGPAASAPAERSQEPAPDAAEPGEQAAGRDDAADPGAADPGAGGRDARDERIGAQTPPVPAPQRRAAAPETQAAADAGGNGEAGAADARRAADGGEDVRAAPPRPGTDAAVRSDRPADTAPHGQSEAGAPDAADIVRADPPAPGAAGAAPELPALAEMRQRARQALAALEALPAAPAGTGEGAEGPFGDGVGDGPGDGVGDGPGDVSDDASGDLDGTRPAAGSTADLEADVPGDAGPDGPVARTPEPPADVAAAPSLGERAERALEALGPPLAPSPPTEATIAERMAGAPEDAGTATDPPAAMDAARPGAVPAPGTAATGAPEPGGQTMAAADAAATGEGPVTILQPELAATDGSVIIRRGDTLWQISRRVYGRGVRYTTIYLANSAQIADPDLILPGQIFDVPREPLDNAEQLHRERVLGDR